MFLHCNSSYIAIFLHHKCFIIAIVPTLFILLQHGISFFSTNCVVFNYCVFFFLGRFFNCDCKHTNIVCVIVSYRDVYLFFFWVLFVLLCALILMFDCFVLHNLEFIFNLYFYGASVLCGYNHEHCITKYFFPLIFVILQNV